MTSDRYTAPMPVCVDCCLGVGDTRGHDAWHASQAEAQTGMARLVRERDEARAAVERLRAAQQLYNGGPVTRNGDRWEVGGVSYPNDRRLMESIERDYLHGVGRARAVMAALDAEAAAPNNDDEVSLEEELAQVMQKADDSDYDWDEVPATSRDSYRRLARAAIAHRARSAEGGVTA